MDSSLESSYSKQALCSSKFTGSVFIGEQLDKIVAENADKTNQSLLSPLSALRRDYKPHADRDTPFVHFLDEGSREKTTDM